ncbi:hypothetical protein GCM10008957_20690 [Deinococcus ruber]|uniref:PELOTA RNA-binding domain-containing protein n=2 Tax=Deinococcus ruber TaxID=1848197 RepID=A0A918C5I6_9DEIO|nr:hypothetical protein GCM10008957_20690 [Deinococcus ruber]
MPMLRPTADLAHTLPPHDVHVHLRAAAPRLVTVAHKEALIRAGESYGTLLTPEARPSDAQTRAYHDALSRNGERVGALVAGLTAELLRVYRAPVLVSLARGGTPVGCAVRRVARRWGFDVPHHTLSIIRGLGIDAAALAEVRRLHPAAPLIFLDGWTGKGSIFQTLRASLPTDVPPRLAVLSDPAGVALHAATRDDLLLPHAVLNATVCGLLSRTFVEAPSPLSGPVPPVMHAARIEEALRNDDLTESYLNALDDLSCAYTAEFTLPAAPPRARAPAEVVLRLAADLGVNDPHLIKPSVGEATRVFLRRQPAHLLLRDAGHPDTLHLLEFAQQAGVPVSVQAALPYLAAAVISPGSPL